MACAKKLAVKQVTGNRKGGLDVVEIAVEINPAQLVTHSLANWPRDQTTQKKIHGRVQGVLALVVNTTARPGRGFLAVAGLVVGPDVASNHQRGWRPTQQPQPMQTVWGLAAGGS